MLNSLKMLPLVSVFALSACGVISPQEPAPAVPEETQPEQPVVASIGSDEVLSRIGTIPAQQVATGECGLFLWAKREDAPLILFQRSNGNTLMRVDGSVQGLARTAMENQLALQFFRNQEFTLADMTIKVAIVPEQTRTLQQGLKVPSGSISISTQSGWSAAIPVAGAIGCQ